MTVPQYGDTINLLTAAHMKIIGKTWLYKLVSWGPPLDSIFLLKVLEDIAHHHCLLYDFTLSNCSIDICHCYKVDPGTIDFDPGSSALTYEPH